MILSAPASSSGGFSKKILGVSQTCQLMTQNQMADIASTSTSNDVSTLDDSDDNTRHTEKFTLSQRKAVKVLKKTWESVGLDHDEEDLKETWYGVIYRGNSGKKKPVLYVGKILN